MEHQNIKMPSIERLQGKLRPPFLLSIPDEIYEELKRVHDNPFVWWLGQVLIYLTRPNEALKKMISDKAGALGFKNRCVGVHVRRTDKLTSEAKLHPLKEYMDEVEKFFKIQSIDKPGNVDKCVYLASDEITVLQEAKKL